MPLRAIGDADTCAPQSFPQVRGVARPIDVIEDWGALVRRHSADDFSARALAKIVRSDLIVVDGVGLLLASEDAVAGFYRLVDAAYD